MRSNEVVRKILEPLRRSLRATDHWDQFREKHTQVIADEKRSFGFDYEDAALDHREFEITNGKPKRSLTIYDQSYLVQEMQRTAEELQGVGATTVAEQLRTLMAIDGDEEVPYAELRQLIESFFDDFDCPITNKEFAQLLFLYLLSRLKHFHQH